MELLLQCQEDSVVSMKTNKQKKTHQNPVSMEVQ